MQRFSFLVLAPLAVAACGQDQPTDSAALAGLAPGFSATAAGGAAGAL
jgi:hypothetical protein